MKRNVGLYASILNGLAVLAFAVCMPLGFSAGNYLSSVLIAFSFVSMTAAFAAAATPAAKAAGYSALAFAAMYALCNIAVYFVQLTTVRQQPLSAEAASLLDYSQFGMMFALDLLGYCLMAVSTFFSGLSIAPKTTADRWLKGLLMVHGVFAIACFIMPMLGLFHANMQGGEWIGTAVLEFWCAYFLPVGILSALHFARQPAPSQPPQA